MAVTMMSDLSRMLEAGITDVFTDNFKAYPIEWPEFVTRKTADKEVMKYDSMGNIAAAQEKVEGGSFTYRKISQAYQTTVRMKTWGNGVRFTMEAKAYDLYKTTVETEGVELARTIRELQENNVIKWIDNVAAAGYALADGQPIASNSHPCKDAPGTVNDTYATASTLTDPENHKTMIKMFADFKNHAGGFMKTYPNKGLSHRYNMSDIEEIYQSDRKANEFSNTKNVLPTISWKYSTYMTDTNAWGMWDDRYPHLIYVEYQGVQKNAGQDKELTLDFWYNAYEMYNTSCLPNVGIIWNDGA